DDVTAEVSEVFRRSHHLDGADGHAGAHPESREVLFTLEVSGVTVIRVIVTQQIGHGPALVPCAIERPLTRECTPVDVAIREDARKLVEGDEEDVVRDREPSLPRRAPPHPQPQPAPGSGHGKQYLAAFGPEGEQPPGN